MEDYPKTMAELERRFATEDACVAYLAWLRWPDGFSCPACQCRDAWQTGRRLWHCRRCGVQTSVTAGTVLHRSRKPLTLWFRAMWHIVGQKYGTNAMGLQRALELGSYETAWQWLHKLRHAMVRPGRDRLSGRIQADETFWGKRTRGGKRGRGAEGKEMIAIAVEDKSPDGVGRIRLRHVPDGQAVSLNAFLATAVEPGSLIVTDDFQGYAQVSQIGCTRQVVPSEQLKLPHLVASLLKRWLMGTYQGAVNPSHLDYYLDEFTFRFNRRTSRSRGKLFYRLVQQALMVDPLPRSAMKTAKPPCPEDLDVL
jgi:hypothetical protein